MTMRVASRLQTQAHRAVARQARPEVRAWPRRPIPCSVHDAVLAQDWPTVMKWLRDLEATVALGHPPLLATPGDLHVQHPNLVGDNLGGRPEETGPLNARGNTILHAVLDGVEEGRQLPPPEVFQHILRACPHAVTVRNADGQTALHLLAQRQQPDAATGRTPHEPMLAFLGWLLHGPKNAAAALVKDRQGCTPLHMAAARVVEPEPEPESEPDADGAGRAEGAKELTLQLVEQLLAVHPAARGSIDQRSRTPLHEALYRRHRTPIIRALLGPDGDPSGAEAARTLDDRGKAPLHVLCALTPVRPFRREALRMLLHRNPEAARIAVQTPGGTFTALHLLCMAALPVPVLEMVHSVYPEALSIPGGGSGSLPLHLAAAGANVPSITSRDTSTGSLNVCKWILSRHPEAASVPDSWNGQLALHHAVRSRKPRVIILLLYEACREAAKTRDVHYRHPYQYTDFKRVTSFEKLAASTMAVNAAASDEEAAKAFRRIDADNSGELDLAEMGKLSRFFGKPLSHEQLMAAFEEIDTDQSGTIDMQEFLVWWRRHHGMAYARDGGPTEKRSRAVTETAELTGEVGGQDGWEGESDEWHADVFALLSAEVLGERLLVSGAPPVEAYALYERATRVYVQIKSALDGTYTRPRKMMQRQACLRQLCEIEDRIAGAQASGALIDVVEGCHDALNLIEDGFDVDTSRSIHRLQGVMSETMYSIANKMEPESVRLQNRLTAKAVELDNIIVREERWMPADRDPAQEEYLLDFSQVSKVTVSSAFSDRHRGGGSVVSALDVSSPQPMASALGGGGDGGGSAVLTLGRYHAAGIGGVEAELAQREREALAEDAEQRAAERAAMRLAKEEAEDARRMKHNPRSRFVTKSGPEVFAQSRIQELVGMRSAKSTRTVARQEDNVLAQQLMQNEVGVKPMQRLKKEAARVGAIIVEGGQGVMTVGAVVQEEAGRAFTEGDRVWARENPDRDLVDAGSWQPDSQPMKEG